MTEAGAPFVFFPLFLLLGLTCIVLRDPYIQRFHRKILLLIIFLCLSMLLQNYLESLLIRGPLRKLERTLLVIYGYTVRPVIIVLAYPLIAQKKRFLPAWILIGLNAAVHLSALFSPVCFTITANNHYLGGPLKYFCLYVSLALLAYLLYLTIHEYLRSRLQEILIPLLSISMILVAIWLDGKTPEDALMISYLTIAMSVSSVLYYIWLHHQFVLEHEEDLKAQQRIQIMMSQIQPHFLYNTLSAIQVLCHTNPEKAADITEDFGSYLRQNLAFLNNSGLIPFQKELEHTKTYAEIEETRFPNIRVTYDIQDSTFSLPALTLQPIVENAIRHGVRIREEGVVTVSTRKEKEWHLLEIRDNGTGFDVNMLDTADDSHIGLRNVRSRIESMCNGTLTVQSVIDEGTTVMIQIPDNSEEADQT